MIVRVYLAKPLHPRGLGATVVEDAEARDLAAAGVLEERLELVTPQPGVTEGDVAGFFAELFPNAQPQET